MAAGSVRYTIPEILKWADEYKARVGRWPRARSGAIWGTNRTWEGVNTALAKGTCGLPGGDSLLRLLKRRRGASDSRVVMPDLTLEQILAWADLHHAQTGRWPGRNSGPVVNAPWISWTTIHRRLKRGAPGLKGGRTLGQLLREHRGAIDGRGSKVLTERLVLRWARDHRKRTGRWPVTMSGPVLCKPDETWVNIDVAMRNARRGFPVKMSLSQLIRREIGEERYWRDMGKPIVTRNGPRVRVISAGGAKPKRRN